MVINEDLIQILNENHVDIEKAKLYFLCIYHDIDTNFVLLTEKDITTLNLLKIVDRDYESNTVTWNIPLYQEECGDSDWDWVREWMKGFAGVNPERKGVYATCVSRMKKFFGKHPKYRKEDVFTARDMYLRTIDNPKYCMTSHKFIFDSAGVMQNSSLLGYCEKITENDNELSTKGKMM